MSIVEQITPRLYIQLFKGRTDRVQLYPQNLKRVISQQVQKGEFELMERAKAHLGGTTRLAFYNMMDDNTISWAVVIFTEGETSKNAAKDSAFFVKELRKLGLRGVRRERSMSVNLEYNVWVFFNPPVLAKKVRYLFFTLLEKLGLPKNLPILPTNDENNPGSYGQAVWLPYFNGIDKWLDNTGTPYVNKGVKDGHTIFVDDEGNPLKRNLLEVPRCSEGDLDMAMTVITGPLGSKYLPGVGLHVPESAFYKMIDKCAGYKEIVKQIEDNGATSEDGLIRLGAFLRAVGLDELFTQYKEKVSDLDDKKFERAFDAYTGPVFPPCLELKQLEICPPAMNCFEKRSPIREKLGTWREDSKMEKNIEPTAAEWFYKGVEETSGQTTPEGAPPEPAKTNGAAAGFPTMEMPLAFMQKPPVEVKVISIGDFVAGYEKKLTQVKDDFAAGKTFNGFSTGSEPLDETLEGIKRGTLTALFGPPGAGKSTFAKQLQDTVADKAKVPTLYITYDMSIEDLYRRTLARMSGVPIGSIAKGELNDESWQKISRVNKIFKEQMNGLVSVVEADEKVPMEGIRKAIDKTKAQFVVVDFIQAIPEHDLHVEETESLEALQLNRLKQIARSTNAAVLAISNSSMSKYPQYSADIVLQMHQQVNPQIASNDKQPFAVILNVEKNREGKSMVSIQYTFFPPRMIYYNEKKIDYRPIKF